MPCWPTLAVRLRLPNVETAIRNGNVGRPDDDNHHRPAYPLPMNWNTHLLLLLNAANEPGTIMQIIVGLLASWPVLLAPVLLTCLWVGV